MVRLKVARRILLLPASDIQKISAKAVLQYLEETNHLPSCRSRSFFLSEHILTFRVVEAAISSTASASNRTSTLAEPGLYLIYELADKHDYQNQQLTIYKGTLLVKMIA